MKGIFYYDKSRAVNCATNGSDLIHCGPTCGPNRVRYYSADQNPVVIQAVSAGGYEITHIPSVSPLGATSKEARIVKYESQLSVPWLRLRERSIFHWVLFFKLGASKKRLWDWNWDWDGGDDWERVQREQVIRWHVQRTRLATKARIRRILAIAPCLLSTVLSSPVLQNLLISSSGILASHAI